MFPASCRLLMLSKSNSSTFEPSATTTRVSSGCVASISIFFAIDSIAARRGRSDRAALSVLNERGACDTWPTAPPVAVRLFGDLTRVSSWFPFAAYAAGVSGRCLRTIESGPHKPSRSGRNLRWRRFLLKNSQCGGRLRHSQRFTSRLHSQLTDLFQMEFSQYT